MRRINTTTKGKITDANGKSFDGFVERDPSGGEQSTHLSDSWCNNLQEEICNVIEGVGGHTVSGSDVQVEKYDQMFQAIKLLVDTATPIGSVKAMPIKMSDSYMARWVPIDEGDDEAASIIGTKGTAYLSKEMAKNCEKVEGDKAGWYKLVTGNKENGEASGAFGWALADGTFPLPISSFGEDDGQRPTKQLILKKVNLQGHELEYPGEILSDTEYGETWKRFANRERTFFFKTGILGSWWWFGTLSDAFNVFSTSYKTRMQQIDDEAQRNTVKDEYFLKEEDFFPPKDDTPIDLSIWTENNTKKPKLIPNLNDKTFLMGSNEEDLSMRVEGKNGFIMQPYHMPPHRHDIAHYHDAASGAAGGHKHRVPYISGTTIDTDKVSWGLTASGYFSPLTYGTYPNEIYTDAEQSHGHDIVVHYVRKYSEITGGYRVDNSLHNEGGDMEGKDLYGTVPIDLRPKRLAVYYYIRVI